MIETLSELEQAAARRGEEGAWALEFMKSLRSSQGPQFLKSFIFRAHKKPNPGCYHGWIIELVEALYGGRHPCEVCGRVTDTEVVWCGGRFYRSRSSAVAHILCPKHMEVLTCSRYGVTWKVFTSTFHLIRNRINADPEWAAPPPSEYANEKTLAVVERM